MAMVETARHMPALERFSADDFETASIRSAAPSYISDVPSYHTIANEPVPPYSPPTAPSYSASASASASPSPGASYTAARHNSAPTLLGPAPPGASSSGRRTGLPPIPPATPRRRSDLPSLGEFRIPTWSTVSANPTYHRVASRRVQAATSQNHIEAVRRVVLDRVVEEEAAAAAARAADASAATAASTASTASTAGPGGAAAGGGGGGGAGRVRPLEDPYLVGEEAAARARRERLARENGEEVLIREDRRWDFFLAQMKDWEQRERSWKQFRREMEHGSRGGRLARRIAATLR